MTAHTILNRLFQSNAQSRFPRNVHLSKKIILSAQLGRLQVNGLPPDDKIALAQYLFDSEHVLLDLTRLSSEKKLVFNEWLLDHHQIDKTSIHRKKWSINDYRGFTAESYLSFWGRIKTWLNKKHIDFWILNNEDNKFSAPLSGIEIQQGQHGIIFGFYPPLFTDTYTQYSDSKDSQYKPMGNTKKVLITDYLVDILIDIKINELQFETLFNLPHPHAVHVNNSAQRLQQMYEYRSLQGFLIIPWYQRVWKWLIALFNSPKNSLCKTSSSSIKKHYKDEKFQIEELINTHELLVKEKRPDIENVVYSGGGAKIFGHVGFWKAIKEAGIQPHKFAGSSAGAIMALLSYLNYSAVEMNELFKNFRQEHLVHFNININGISDSHSLKTALDYAIAFKLAQIVEQLQIPYPQSKITFATLESIRQQHPQCGIGKELIVTATNRSLGITRYFSYHHSPDFEISEAVKLSASFPIIYRSTVVDEHEVLDGGILTNLPTEVFSDDHTTLLESEFANNLKLLAVQFDTGSESIAINRLLERVYKENFFINWMYRVLTGVNDPASAWEKDRLKLRQYSAQSILINISNVSSSSFGISEEKRAEIVKAGYESTHNYLKARYLVDSNSTYGNDEWLYTKFDSFKDLLSFCCHRGDKNAFELVYKVVAQDDKLNTKEILLHADTLRDLYFTKKNSHKLIPTRNKITFFGNEYLSETKQIKDEHKMMLAIYPVFLKLLPSLLKNANDKKIFDIARHSFMLVNPFTCIEHFEKIKNPVHVLLHILIVFIKEVKNTIDSNDMEDNKNYLNSMNNFSLLLNVFNTIPISNQNEFFGCWNLSARQSVRILKMILANQTIMVAQLLSALARGEEPLECLDQKLDEIPVGISEIHLEHNQLSSYKVA